MHMYMFKLYAYMCKAYIFIFCAPPYAPRVNQPEPLRMPRPDPALKSRAITARRRSPAPRPASPHENAVRPSAAAGQAEVPARQCAPRPLPQGEGPAAHRT